MFFEPPEKITTRKKKRYSRLSNGWNKSQITACCVKIQTHQLWLEKIMTKKKYDTVVWSSVMSKYEHHQSHFNLRKFLLGFFILQKQWDPNFLLVCIFSLLCTTVPFFSGSIFFWSYVSTIIGARVKIWTPITTQKNYDPPPKRYSRLAGYVFRTTRKNYDPKKSYSHLTDGWNKSQITVCCVKIRTHQLQLEKIMTRKKGTTQSTGRLSCQNTNTTIHSLTWRNRQVTQHNQD